ncbi:MAG: M48 family metallopeptidase [Prevotella sp.]|nr:M48 family metallopeptidase [Prevotella sp.]
MNLNYNNKSYPSLEEFIQAEKENTGSLYGKRMEFAHNIDSAVIKALEATHVQKAMNKLADLLVNIQSGTEISSGIVIDANNFPEINGILRHCCKTLGISIPHGVVSARMSGINAYASGTVDNPYLLISDLSTHLLTKEELTFIIGHECGHLAMEHLVYHMIGRQLTQLGQLIPVVGPMLVQIVNLPLSTWSRYSEITADRAGLLCCGDLRTAQRALMKLESSFANVTNVDLDTYINQSLESLENMKLGAMQEYLLDHPLTPKRLKALQYFCESELYYRVTGKEIPTGKSLLPDSALKEKTDELLTVLK